MAAPYLSNDGYQYLDAASNVARGAGLCTRIAHFDEQVTGRMPVPFTHFPPGYPLLAAALSRTGLPLETAAWLISALGFLATIWLIWDVGLGLGASPPVIAAAALLWISNSDALSLASSAATEDAFTAVLMALAALMLRDMRAAGRRPWLLPAIGAAAGMAYGLRYAGLFLVPVAAVYIVWRWWRHRATLPWAAAGLLAAGLPIVPIQIRNIVDTGSWRGGFSGAGGHRLSVVLSEAVKSCYYLVFGSGVPVRRDIWIVAFALSLLLLCVFAIRQGRTGWRFPPGALPWLGLLVAAYLGGILLTTLTSIAMALTRYFMPVYPLLLACLAGAVSPLAAGKRYAAVAIMVLAVVVIQSRSLAARPGPARHMVVRETLRQETPNGTTVEQWLRDRLTPEDVLVAVNGQAVHYVLQRPVVALIDPQYSNRPVDEAAFHSLMALYGARYLLVFPGADAVLAPEQNAIPFLRNLAAGESPKWLAPAVRTSGVAVYECAGCAR
jgi:4-amino-4-deoxy-L-arabinose transferase-like glycosyltransferase